MASITFGVSGWLLGRCLEFEPQELFAKYYELFFPAQDMEEVVLTDKILHQKENYDTFSILEQTKVCI